MSEPKRTCILCGEKEQMVGYICLSCQEKIQREAVVDVARSREGLKEASDYKGDGENE
jgi:hypothetical protein